VESKGVLGFLENDKRMERGSGGFLWNSDPHDYHDLHDLDIREGLRRTVEYFQ
jgi:hypothetical protein